MPTATRRSKKDRPVWADAIRLRRLQLDLKQEDVEARSGDLITQSTISNIELGKLDPSTITARRLGGLLKALRWTPQQFIHATGVDLPGFVDDKVIQVDQTHNTRMIPVYAHVSGGPGVDGGQVVDYVSIPDDWPGEYVAFQIEGSSMEPTIKSGAVVKVRIQDHAEPGQIVVFWSPDRENCIKEFTGTTPDGYYVFRAHNDDLPPEQRTLYLKDIHIKGYVVSVETLISRPKISTRVN